jgi:hypothetical protein
MYRRLAWALPALLVLGCKPKPPQIPDDEDRATSSGYGDAAYATGIQPIQVCEHLARMAAAEAGVLDPQIDPSTMAACSRELDIEAATRGTANWNEIASCVLRAQTDVDINDCDETHPMPTGPTSWDRADTERERIVCEHMLEIIMYEAAAELGTGAPPLSEQDRRELSDECVESFMAEQRPNLDAGAYEQLLTCIADAQSGAQMQTC